MSKRPVDFEDLVITGLYENYRLFTPGKHMFASSQHGNFEWLQGARCNVCAASPSFLPGALNVCFLELLAEPFELANCEPQDSSLASTICQICMYVYVCMYAHVYTHTNTLSVCTYIHTYTYTHIHTHIYTYTHIHIYIYIHIHTCICTNIVYTYIHLFIHSFIHAYIDTSIHRYIDTSIHRYIDT